MTLRDTFHSAAETAFNVFSSLVKQGVYTYVVDDGFTSSSTDYPINVIVGSFSQEDVQRASFSALIQPTDMQGLVKGSDLSVPVTTEGVMSVDGINYGIVAFDTDPAEALFILLLRKR